MKELFQEGKRATIIAGTGTILLAVGKGIVGLISGSVVLTADAIHSAADGFGTFLAFVGLKIAQKKPTEKFPFGFYKAENITAFIISFLILFAGFNIARQSFNKLFTESELEIASLAIGLAVLDAVAMFLIGSYEIKVGKKINSQSLIADGTESRLHLLSSSVVLIGLIAALLKIQYLEGAAGIFISLFIFKEGFDTLKDSLFALMDESPSKETEEKIKGALNEISGMKDFSNLKLRKSGPLIFGEVEGKIGKSVNVKRAHGISEGIEREVKKKVPLVDSFAIKLQPYETKKTKICIPIEEEEEGLNSKVSDHFGRTKNFLFAELDHKKVKDFYIKNNPYKDKEKRAGLSASKFVMKEKIESIITKEVGPISFHTLRDNIVEVYQADKDSVEEILKDFSQDNLDLLEKPTREKK